jgi:hypothetical protein
MAKEVKAEQVHVKDAGSLYLKKSLGNCVLQWEASRCQGTLKYMHVLSRIG